MNALYVRIVQKNKLIFLSLLLFFSLVSIFMPHGFFEAHEHHDYEGVFNHAINNNKPSSILKKLFKKLRIILFKIFKFQQLVLNPTIIENIRLTLLNMCFSELQGLRLFVILCLCFHGGKYKHNRKHSDLLPLMV
ncbi:hypothetical protein SAMN02745133_03076 [Desulforamulus putei DSM 12395]|uniref:Uncharacterized protein n=1 Tax=Desulforamulus putei DSM 12395 TaxID=1121429 RepID=A0A1M5D132_9FIRM|nr:hypothetical protein SAMN02745133_03076 [Desulforamulus putei DSM 12395]